MSRTLTTIVSLSEFIDYVSLQITQTFLWVLSNVRVLHCIGMAIEVK